MNTVGENIRLSVVFGSFTVSEGHFVQTGVRRVKKYYPSLPDITGKIKLPAADFGWFPTTPTVLPFILENPTTILLA